jgi:hypothetical protein
VWRYATRCAVSDRITKSPPLKNSTVVPITENCRNFGGGRASAT